jgi:Asp/Glu/hydantoin racemase
MTVNNIKAKRILVVNPNTSVFVTKRLEAILSGLNLPNTVLSYWTCPTGPSIIKTEADMYESTAHCMPLLMEIIDNYDGFLGACYADHPLTRLLQSYAGSKPVVGVFDASINAALQLVGPGRKFTILTTGSAFEGILRQGVEALLRENTSQLAKFGGVVGSGIGLRDLLPEAREQARTKVMTAAAAILRSGKGGQPETDVIVVGGVILAGMENWVHEACELELGAERGLQIKVVDQLRAAMITLHAIVGREAPLTIDFAEALV